MTVLMPSLPPQRGGAMTSTPAPSGRGLSWAARIRSGQAIATPPDNSPAAPTPALAIRNLRRFISGIWGSLARQVFGGVDRGGDELRRGGGQGFEGGGGAIRPGPDAEQVTGGVEPVGRGGVGDRRQVTGFRQRGGYPQP